VFVDGDFGEELRWRSRLTDDSTNAQLLARLSSALGIG
jgi:hypothetical protein